MKISIITVCYNSESTIEDTIKSVLSQDYDDIEYIIIDGGSTDRTLDIVNKYADRIESVVSEPDNGIYDAMNKGIEIATGELIGILNSDDLFASERTISEVAEKVKSLPRNSLFYGAVAIVDREEIDKVRRYYSIKRFTKRKLKVGIMPPHPATFVFKSVYEDIGSYQTDYRIAADFEFYVRATIKHDIPAVNIGVHVVNMRDGGISTSGINFFKISSGEMTRALKNNGVWSNSLITSIRLPLKFWSKISGRPL
ncbi:glycosyl transferase [Aliidiomarina iranensis]|uniref:Glycosyl transferase n=1 Tax=Aliidiomarina iranensis TaxID=1434071 RepID=A0A432VTA5_9GAMM|nr:glycosyltransferase family 2 protein [Aliidiomarina iranensis]RUO19610.1 glycosyl transferase [Aliidiomarina iranensis]